MDDHECVTSITSTKLGCRDLIAKQLCLDSRSYVEAAGLICALREGISIHALTRPIQRIEEIL